jgi:hypothetical protein
MTDYSHILLNKSPLQLRLLGARGGKAFGRNQRLRRAPLPTPPPSTAALTPLCDLSKTSDRLSIRNVRYADLLILFMTPLVPEQHVFFQ